MVQSRIEDLSPVVKKLSVELPKERVNDALDREFSGLSRTVKLKGYRAGHVPRRLVEKYFGDDVKKTVAQKLVNLSIYEALAEHKLTPIAPPRVENGDIANGTPFKYVATVEVRPNVDLKDYEGLTAPKIDAEITDAQVDEQLESIRKEQSLFVPVEGRDVVEPGDYVSADYEGFLEGAALKGAKREAVLLETVPGSLLENKAEGLIGAKVGETRELAATFPVDYQVEELRGKEARFQATVKALKKREVPALDDQLVQDLGGTFKTVAELRERVKNDLTGQKRERSETAQREALLTALAEKNPIEAPPALVERNVDAMLQGMLQGFGNRGIDIQRLGINIERLRDDLRGRAVLEVKGFLLLDAVADKEKIEVSEADVEAHYEKLAKEMTQPVEKIRTAFNRPDAASNKDGLKARLRQDKALAFLLSKANLT